LSWYCPWEWLVAWRCSYTASRRSRWWLNWMEHISRHVWQFDFETEEEGAVGHAMPFRAMPRTAALSAFIEPIVRSLRWCAFSGLSHSCGVDERDGAGGSGDKNGGGQENPMTVVAGSNEREPREIWKQRE